MLKFDRRKLKKKNYFTLSTFIIYAFAELILKMNCCIFIANQNLDQNILNYTTTAGDKIFEISKI